MSEIDRHRHPWGGKYSSTWDVSDPLISPLSKRSDHQEAEGYIGKTLSKLGIDPNATPVTPLLKELSITYVVYKRAFYESKCKDDLFFKKYVEYEKKLRDLTAHVIKEAVKEDKPITYMVASDFVHEGNVLDIIERYPEAIMYEFKKRDYDDLLDDIGGLLRCEITEAGLLEKIKDKLIASVELVHEDSILGG